MGQVAPVGDRCAGHPSPALQVAGALKPPFTQSRTKETFASPQSGAEGRDAATAHPRRLQGTLRDTAGAGARSEWTGRVILVPS